MQRNIGETCVLSTGRAYSQPCHIRPVPKKNYPTVWSRVKEALREARLPTTQSYAARICDIKQASVSGWNKAGGYPTIENAVTLAERTQVTVDWLLTGRPPKRARPESDPIAQRRWDVWPQLSDIARGRILQIIAEETPAPIRGATFAPECDLTDSGVMAILELEAIAAFFVLRHKI